MADDQKSTSTEQINVNSDEGGGTAVAVRTRPRPQRPQIDRLPPWKVLLHNDDANSIEHVVRVVMDLAHLNEQAAIMLTLEAHNTGVALLLATHREHAELLQEQFTSKKLTVTIEPDR